MSPVPPEAMRTRRRWWKARSDAGEAFGGVVAEDGGVEVGGLRAQTVAVVVGR